MPLSRDKFGEVKEGQLRKFDETHLKIPSDATK